MAEILGALVALLIVAFMVYAAAHTWLVRPLIRVVEHLVGREFFPFLDRWDPLGRNGREPLWERTKRARGRFEREWEQEWEQRQEQRQALVALLLRLKWRREWERHQQERDRL